uniref:C-type lectin domain family 4 member G-like n=1 Tax=Pundamilia nyererei TaxID=303518 RepID=A0A3B4EW19_9CICH
MRKKSCLCQNIYGLNCISICLAPAEFLSDKKSNSRCRHYQQLACCLGTLCIILVLVITVLEKNVTNLTAENQNLTGKNEELEAEKKNLTDQIQNMTTSWNELNVSRAQWSIDVYCPKINNNRMCVVCQAGWDSFQSGCYAINDAQTSEQQKTWEGAQDDCIGKISDLAVLNNETEKSYISGNSWWNSGNSAYWIGLRVKDGNWKWVDGRNLTNSAWIPGSPSDGQCAISVRSQGFKSVSCTAKNRWICKKKALTL